MMQLLRQRWSTLEIRERRLLLLAGPLVLLMLLYLLLWQPLLDYQDRKTTLLIQQQQTQALLQSAQGRLVPVRILDARQWQALAASHGLRQARIEPQGEHWLIEAEARSHQSIQRFLQAAAAEGWHWRDIKLEGNPLRVKILLVAV